jgi:hypothetical protein
MSNDNKTIKCKVQAKLLLPSPLASTSPSSDGKAGLNEKQVWRIMQKLLGYTNDAVSPSLSIISNKKTLASLKQPNLLTNAKETKRCPLF